MNAKSEPEGDTRLCVVLDTNVWRNEFLLRTPLSAALLFRLKTSGGKIGLPEVVEREISAVIDRAGQKLNSEIQDRLRQVRLLAQSSPEFSPPDFLAAAKQRLEQLSEFLVRVEFTSAHSRSALDRVIDERPPNRQGREEFKDSAIWEAVLDLAKKYRVHFVTRDKGFWEDKDMSRVRPELDEEGGGRVFLHCDLTSCLKRIEPSTPSVDLQRIADLIAEAIDEKVRSESTEKRFQLGKRFAETLEPFLTEDHNALAIHFELRFELGDITDGEGSERHQPALLVEGDCLFAITEEAISNIRFETMEFSWIDPSGERIQRRNVYVEAGVAVIGAKRIRHSLRKRLDE